MPKTRGNSFRVVIKDPLIEPFYIEVDEYGFVVYAPAKDMVKAKRPYNPMGHFATMGYALKYIAKQQPLARTEAYTLSEHQKAFEQAVERCEAFGKKFPELSLALKNKIYEGNPT